MLQAAMARHRERLSGGERGFTLIELLIVIVILGILAAIVVFSVAGIQDKGNDSACKAEKKTLETAIEAYYAKNTAYAANAAALTTAPNKFLREVPAHYTTDITGAIGGSCP
jgi:general secretion pathway protein G